MNVAILQKVAVMVVRLQGTMEHIVIVVFIPVIAVPVVPVQTEEVLQLVMEAPLLPGQEH